MIFNKISIVFALAAYGLETVCAFPPQIYNQNYKPHPFNYNSKYYYTSAKPAPDPTYEDEVTITPIQTDYREGDQFNYRSIQYAPLISRSDGRIINEENKYVEPTVTETDIANPDTYKSNIEPRLEMNQEPIAESRTTIVHGHNIHVPKSNSFSPAFNSAQRKNYDFTTTESVKQDVYANPSMYNYDTKYKTEQIAKNIDDVAGTRRQLTIPITSEHLYPVLTKHHKNSESLINERVLHEKESPFIQPQLIYVRPYRLHLNTARAYNNVHVPIKNVLINKILPPCKGFEKLDSTHLDEPSSKQTKLYAIHNNCIYRRL